MRRINRSICRLLKGNIWVRYKQMVVIFMRNISITVLKGIALNHLEDYNIHLPQQTLDSLGLEVLRGGDWRRRSSNYIPKKFHDIMDIVGYKDEGLNENLSLWLLLFLRQFFQHVFNCGHLLHQRRNILVCSCKRWRYCCYCLCVSKWS